jgi:TrmH family RNA methyltransferase
VTLSQRRTRLVGRLRSRKTREREGFVLVEGVRAVREALDADVDVSFAVVAPRLATSEEGRAIRVALGPRSIEEVTDRELEALSDTESSQGVLLVVREPAETGRTAGRESLLVLDGVQDPGNAGTLVRGAVAFGLDGVVFLDGSVDPWATKTVRASAGTIFRIDVTSMSAPELIEELARHGVPLFAAASDGANVEGWKGTPRFALAVGNEGAGVRPGLREAAVAVVAVPMRGPAESLNVGVAGSILMHVLTAGAGE